MAVRQVGLADASDNEIMDYAVNDDRIVVSHDTDFGALLAFREVSRRPDLASGETIGSLRAPEVRKFKILRRDLRVVVASQNRHQPEIDDQVSAQLVPLAVGGRSSLLSAHYCIMPVRGWVIGRIQAFAPRVIEWVRNSYRVILGWARSM